MRPVMIDIYGIGNPLVDIICSVSDEDLEALKLDKGIMRLVDLEERKTILARIEGRDIVYRSGGSCPNTLSFLSALGIECAVAGKIGDDNEGRAYSEHLPGNHLKNELVIDPEGATGTSIILVTPDTERTMNTYLGANRLFTRADLHEATIEEAKYFYFTGYMWDTEEQKDAVLHTAKVIRKNGGKIILDLADPFAVNRNREEFRGLVEEQADIVFANAEEAGLLYGHEEEKMDADDAAQEIADRCGLAVVKDGASGSVVKRRGEPAQRIQVRTITAVDTTGAGDMYAAGFIYGVISGLSDRDSGICGSYLASRIVETFGAQFTPDERARVAEEVFDGTWRYTD